MTPFAGRGAINAATFLADDNATAQIRLLLDAECCLRIEPAELLGQCREVRAPSTKFGVKPMSVRTFDESAQLSECLFFIARGQDKQFRVRPVADGERRERKNHSTADGMVEALPARQTMRDVVLRP
ncbi:MAG TPA: hypothetical protein VGC30_01780, partial [Dokdonella sp.]